MNIAEILKDAPKGTKLYSPLYGEVILDYVDFDVIFKPIKLLTPQGEYLHLTASGRYTDNQEYVDAECVLFPSKENRDWTTFKIEQQFPETIGECWRVENKAFSDNDEALAAWNRKITQFRTLLTCRNAWWYTDNDWRPDWCDGEDKFVICVDQNDIFKDKRFCQNCILAFRTEKIRDSFFDTFKDLIEDCKELL